MITFNQTVSTELVAQHVVFLPFHQRVKGRLRIKTEDGLDAGIVTERGSELKGGDKLSDGSGRILEIRASNEPVSVATTNDGLLFSRACYHIGNRHAEVQIKAGTLIYLSDPVLDEMLSLLGLDVSNAELTFSPEKGAYHKGHAHSHGDHSHSHSHSH
ncbi:UNVERIFIED_CONTAM: hypothetical protein GTU68_065639 [Idotea baltica]|nr:hypothetical protein [Idotea baltica]